MLRGERDADGALGGADRDSPEVLALFRSGLEVAEMNVSQVLGRGLRTTLDGDDLRSFALEGLLMAARTFDASKRVPFRRWANRRIQVAISDGIRRWEHRPRPCGRDYRRAAKAGAPLRGADRTLSASHRRLVEARVLALRAKVTHALAVELVSIAPFEEPEDAYGRRRRGERLRRAVERLPPFERRIVELHDLEEEPLEVVVATLGVSKSWIARVRRRALDRLRGGLGELEEGRSTR